MLLYSNDGAILYFLFWYGLIFAAFWRGVPQWKKLILKRDVFVHIPFLKVWGLEWTIWLIYSIEVIFPTNSEILPTTHQFVVYFLCASKVIIL